AGDRVHLLGVVGEEPHPADAEVVEDLRAGPVLADVGGETELQVGLDGVVALVLELVRLELLDQADAAAFLPDVEEDAALLAGDEGERGFHLLAALAAERVEDVAREAFGVDPDGDGLVLHYRLAVLVGADVAHAEGDVEIFVDLRLVEVDAERAEP